MFRTLSQIEDTLLKKAVSQLREDLKPKMDEIRKILTGYGVSDVNRAVAIVHDGLIEHIETPLAQESILKHKSDELVMKLEDLEDLVYDVCGDAISDSDRYP